MPSAAEEAILGAAGSAGACVVSHPLDTARARQALGLGVRAVSWRDGKLVNAVDHEEIIDEEFLVAELRGQDVVVEERLFNHQSIIELVGANANALCTFRVLTVADASTRCCWHRRTRRGSLQLWQLWLCLWLHHWRCLPVGLGVRTLACGRPMWQPVLGRPHLWLLQ